MKTDKNGDSIIGSEIEEAKEQAAKLKEAIANLSKMELVVGAKYIAEVSRLIQAVEAI